MRLQTTIPDTLEIAIMMQILSTKAARTCSCKTRLLVQVGAAQVGAQACLVHTAKETLHRCSLDRALVKSHE